MPWQERSIMSQRREFVVLASAPDANMAQLCRRFGISRESGYQWLRRFRAGGEPALVDRSRRPAKSPNKSSEETERLIVQMREAQPVWGPRKIKARLEAQGHRNLPVPSTITQILHRHGLITPEASAAATPWRRFEHEHPNDLWQMDFKGPIATRRGDCHALTVLDDHSRYAIGVRACADQSQPTVRRQLGELFTVYGLPWRILADNGGTWAGQGGESWSALEVWLLKLGVIMIHGRPYHPQTQGKDERFHRTLKAELLRRVDIKSVAHAQSLFDPWRDVYNLERPHEALGLKPPMTRYVLSTRPMPAELPRLEPGPGQIVGVVKEGGHLRFAGRRWYLGRAWNQETVGLVENARAHVTDVYFGPYLIAQLDPAHGVAHRVRIAPVGSCAPSLRDPHAVQS
jgi:transposase InsO family protein